MGHRGAKVDFRLSPLLFLGEIDLQGFMFSGDLWGFYGGVFGVYLEA